MGREIQCRMKSSGKWFQGKALLETSEIIFRGEHRLKIPFESLSSVVARDGALHLKWPGDSAMLELGEQAEKWAHAILHPKTTADKLGIKPGLTRLGVSPAWRRYDARRTRDGRRIFGQKASGKFRYDFSRCYHNVRPARDHEADSLTRRQRSALGRLSQGPPRDHRTASAQRRTRGRTGGHKSRQLFFHPNSAEICPPQKPNVKNAHRLA